jgi:hypothetical protein
MLYFRKIAINRMKSSVLLVIVRRRRRLAGNGNQQLVPMFRNVPSRACIHALLGSGCLPEHGHPKYAQPWQWPVSSVAWFAKPP